VDAGEQVDSKLEGNHDGDNRDSERRCLALRFSARISLSGYRHPNTPIQRRL
jgi:hypothetical protein